MLRDDGAQCRWFANAAGGLTFVLRPFWWPMNMKETPSMEPMPHTMAGSSSPARSPCSSTNLSCSDPGDGPVVKGIQREGCVPRTAAT